MKKQGFSKHIRSGTEEAHKWLSSEKRAPISVFFILIACYLLASYYLQMTSTSDSIVTIMGLTVPLRSITGAFSSIANICIVLIVVLFKKPGFIVAMIALLAQVPQLCIGLFANHNPNTISGVATDTLMILAVVLLHLNNINAKKYQSRLQEQVVTDQLTGLPNRFACSELINYLVDKREKFAVALLDLKNIRNINNTMGQNAVDSLLIEVSERWKTIADNDLSKTHDFIARQTGNEFVLIIRDYDSSDCVLDTILRYEDELQKRITIDDCDYFLSMNVGYTEYPIDANDTESLIACASSALVEAKRNSNSGENICRFSPELMNAKQIVEMERKIRTALENDSLFFMLQPQFDIDHKLSGFEALARIKDTDGSILKPVDFIPIAEKVGLVDKIDRVVFRNAAIFVGDLIRKSGANITLSANISVKHLMRNDFLEELKSIIDACGVPAIQLEIEITESIMIDSIDRAFERIDDIKKLGVRIAIDDFGTGYSSLSYLSNFPADVLKIDKSFIDQMNMNDVSREYVSNIIAIGHVMNFDVISEGVEKPDQLETLRTIGCDYIQGFIWGAPMMPEEAELLVLESL